MRKRQFKNQQLPTRTSIITVNAYDLKYEQQLVNTLEWLWLKQYIWFWMTV